MSFLSVAPDVVTTAAGNLECIASALGDANAVAAIPTTGVMAPAADAVSEAITQILGTHGEEYQALSTEILSFHEQFVSSLNSGMSKYLATEVANAQLGQMGAVNGPAQGLLGHSPVRAPAASDVRPAAASDSRAAAPGAAITTPPVTPVGPVTTPITANIPVFRTSTPLGPLALTLKASLDPITRAVSITGGSLTAPSQLALAVDAIGPYVTTMAALQNSGAAISGALQSGNPLGAAQALLHAPGNAFNGFLYGHQTISETIAAPTGLGLQSLTVDVPLGGVLTGLNNLALTLTPTGGGASTTIPLTGVQVGGLFNALENGESLLA
jgi:PE family